MSVDDCFVGSATVHVSVTVRGRLGAAASIPIDHSGSCSARVGPKAFLVKDKQVKSKIGKILKK